MQLSSFGPGRGFVAHKYRVPGCKSRFSVWFDSNGRAVDAERKDSLGRCFPVPAHSPAWRYIRHRSLAGLVSEMDAQAARTKSA